MTPRLSEKFTCPACSHPRSRVKDSRPVDGRDAVRRIRECVACRARFDTEETMRGKYRLSSPTSSR